MLIQNRNPRRWPIACLCSALVLLSLAPLLSLTRLSASPTTFTTRMKRLQPVCAVITTILEVNQAVEQTINKAKLSLVVVGDYKTNHTLWEKFERDNVNKVVYLSPKSQKALPFNIIKHVPWNHFGRKSVGFMYAASMKCEKIYDFDDDNHLKQGGFEGITEWNTLKLQVLSNDTHVFNPYPYFHSTGSYIDWPRGFPLQFIHDPNTYRVDAHQLTYSTLDNVAIVQSLADHDPDVDAIYRLTAQLPLNFERKNEILVLPRGIYTPWNAQATLISRVAFFGMLLPVTVTGRVSDIWRSYITSRLLWETNYCVGFSSAFVTQYRNPHSYMQDFIDEDDLYKKVDKLLQLLALWTSDQHDSLASAYLDLVRSLVDEKILGVLDLQLAQAWVEDLNAIGYVWPEITSRLPPNEHSSAPIIDQRSGARPETRKRFV